MSKLDGAKRAARAYGTQQFYDREAGMITIEQKRVLNIGSHLPSDFKGEEILIGVRSDQMTGNQIKSIGLSWPLSVGEVILPSVIGPITRFNALGKEVPRRDKPKETHFRDMEFTRTEWHGRDTVEVTDCVWIPYKKYPRRIVPPPGLEISVTQGQDGRVSLVTKPFRCVDSQLDEIAHAVNLFLEIDGVCNVYLRSENHYTMPTTKRLNWRLLPPGQLPWETLRKAVEDERFNQRPRSFAAALNRFEKIWRLNPDFNVIGTGGYRGYVVFGFKAKGLYVFESQQVNNAIYVFGDDWR